MRRFINFVLVLVACLAIFPIYTRYKVAAAPVPPGVHLGGLDLSDLKDTDEIRRHLERIYTEPISLHYGETRLALRPDDINFEVDVAQMVAEATQYLQGGAFLDIAVRHALGIEQQRRDVPVRFMLDSAKLRAQLEAIAAEYDHAPQATRVLPPSSRWAESDAAPAGLPAGYVGSYTRDWTWTTGQPGAALDVDASIPIVIAALTRDAGRDAHLAVTETPAPPATLDDLARELNSVTSNFPGFAAIYIHDLQSDQEGAVDAEVAFSGMSTLKIGLAAAIMRKLANGIRSSDGSAELVGQWLDYALGESNNHAANQLITFLGDGDITAGTRVFTEFMRSLGFESTYMQSGYDVQVQLPQIPTPGNQRTDWQTDPDSNLQSTPTEMGRILSAIYQCTLNEGLLIERYPGEITPDECRAILYYMTHDEFQELIWAGLPRPADAWVVHKHGFAFESHSDVALVWGPSGPYVLSIFLYRKGWMDWENSNGTMKTISRIVWNFFEQQAAGAQVAGAPAAAPIATKIAEQAAVPEPIVLSPPPGYAAIKDEYIPVASTGFR